ncbi:hypothetical protein AVEN_2279-1 [Araneus ventricosus]|uniref:Uncharacterized protein n=1 Tax=Araneus ventricosus TaxID=182803 RepID=A0A4Y2FPP2_ARAVE|nr:hypothetical protein AVEN_2279-1 [Araneus ventricosus]
MKRKVNGDQGFFGKDRFIKNLTAREENNIPLFFIQGIVNLCQVDANSSRRMLIFDVTTRRSGNPTASQGFQTIPAGGRLTLDGLKVHYTRMDCGSAMESGLKRVNLWFRGRYSHETKAIVE